MVIIDVELSPEQLLLFVSSGMFYTPTTNGGMQKWKLGRNMYTLHARFCTFGADLHAQSVIVNKISASELTRKFTKSWLEHFFFLLVLALLAACLPNHHPLCPEALSDIFFFLESCLSTDSFFSRKKKQPHLINRFSLRL